MRGCLTLIVGIIIGVVLVGLAEALLIKPVPLAPAPSATSDVVILFQNAFLTRQLQAQAAQVETSVKLQNLAVQGQADQTLAVSGTATAPGTALTVPVRVVVHPALNNGRVTIQIVTAQLGSLKLPSNWFQPLENQINASINRSLANTQYQIVGVSTTVEGLLVYVNVKS
jgi:hypothetical protein